MKKDSSQDTQQVTTLANDAIQYLTDACQRAILFTDVLRKRGNTYFEMEKSGLPPVLVFDYETILDGSTLKKPVNYDLARIIPRENDKIDPSARPIVVIDPRAGNGPGIGGSKTDSEIGDALSAGHPVYFILFHPDPIPGQTLSDVTKAEEIFIEHVAKLHPDSKKPAVIGNCQAGWAVALLGADKPELTGPLVLNGTPLSYWSGVQGKNPMRYSFGLYGGIWMTHLLCDLGNGIFDGANLELNFENLNAANTLWAKQYNLFSKIDTEEERFLTFEKWWNGFSKMTEKEILGIATNLFIGDKLEKGTIATPDGKQLNLKDIEKPMLIFASAGDNITPQQEALDWIIKVYKSVEEIKRSGKVIVYLLQKHIGHLGIFVGTSIAKKEHKEIIGHIDMLEALKPGLYEMIIDEKEKKHGITDYDTRFEKRTIKDIKALNDNLDIVETEDKEFEHVEAVSEINDNLYSTFVSPWVKMFSTEASAEMLRQLHPNRAKVYLFSDKNPFIKPFEQLGKLVKENRKPVAADNPFLALEKIMSDSIETLLNGYQKNIDDTSEFIFNSIYSSSMMDMFKKL